MADISTYLKQILSAVYGKDVRQSIHDAIQQCYEDGSAVSDAVADVIEAKVKTVIQELIDDGTMASLEVITDDTLSISGAAADAAATGESIDMLKSLIADLNDNIGDSGAITVVAYSLSDTESEFVYIFEDENSIISPGCIRAIDGYISQSTSTTYKYAEVPYTNGMEISTKANAASISDFPPVVVYDNGEYSTPDYETTTVDSTIVQLVTVSGYSSNAIVYVNMYSSDSFSDTELYYYISAATTGNSVDVPTFENEVVPTIDDDSAKEYKTYSSKKIESLIGTKASYPTNGIEHFTVTINKHIQNDNSGTTSVQDDNEEYEDSGVIFLPEIYSATGEATRMIISCHGSGTTIDDDFSVSSKTWNNFFVKMGYAVMDVNGGASDSRHFGAPWTIQSYIKAYHYVIEKYNLKPDVFVLGGSMGGLPAFTLAQCGSIPVVALAGFCPVVDLYRQAWCYPWYGGSSGETYSAQRKCIAEFYNFDNYDSFSGWTSSKTPSDEEKQYFLDNLDKVTGYNPMTTGAINFEAAGIYEDSTDEEEAYQNLIRLSKVPLKIWQSDADPTVPAEYGKYLVQAVKNAGGIAEHRSYPSGGHTPGWGETITVDGNEAYSNEYECYLWFKRFE